MYPSLKDFQEIDPATLADAMQGLAIKAKVTYLSATQTLGTVPANSLITTIAVVRTTAWDVITTFQVGKSGTLNWLIDTTEANVTGAIPAGEAGAAEVIAVDKVVTADTPIVLTLNQGAASAGVGYVVVNFVELNP